MTPRLSSVAERLLPRLDERGLTMDGVRRSRESEKALNAAVAQIAETEPGRLVLDWLADITTRAVLAPTATDAELRQMEGMRQLYAILMARLEAGRKGA